MSEGGTTAAREWREKRRRSGKYFGRFDLFGKDHRGHRKRKAKRRLKRRETGR